MIEIEMANKKALKRFRDRFDKAWKKALLKCLADDLKDINPSQERKEMACQHSNFMVGEYYKIGEDFVILSQEDDYDFVVYSVEHCLDRNNPTVTFKMKDGSIKSRSDLDNYIKLLNGKPPRTLKLEDLNKLWANKHTGKVGRIFISNRGLINFVSGLGVQSVIFGEYRTEEFFDTHAEATQTDLDNLTKG